MGKITIQEIAKILVEKNHIESQAASQFVNEMFAIILERLSQGEAVKVRGLGTFKIVDVEARESVSVRTGERVLIDGHSKVSFIPDTTMKELVNKPFSQFETVILNDGVEFEDMKEPEAPVSEQTETSEEPAHEEPKPEEPKPEEPKSEEPKSVDPEPVNPIPVMMPSFPKAADEKPQQEEPKKSSFWLSFLKLLLVLALMAASAFTGYFYGSMKPLPDIVPDTVYIRETVSDQPETPSPEKAEQKAEPAESVKPEPATPAKTEPATPAKTDVKKPEQPAPAVDKYAEKDARVRLGAYRIVGLDHEVKVLAGQTFYSICKANLGPDMECYVEVYNNLPSNPTVKEGQIIKIPKLELKKKRKK